MAGETENIRGFQAQLEDLKESMEKGFDEIKAMLRFFDERVRGVENREASCQPVVISRLNSISDDLEEHALSIKELTNLANTQANAIMKMIEAQNHLDRLLKWGLGIVTAVITMFVIALMTGQAYVVFK
jgi:hypothetical protein